MPMDRPQWKVWAQRNYLQSEKGIVIWKAHHSLADGLSSMALNLQLDETYDLSKMLKFPKMPFIGRMYYRLMVPFMIPLILLDALFIKVDRNPLHDGVRNLTGKKTVAVSECFGLDKVKKASKALDLTINELMMASLSVALKRWFEEQGEKSINKIHIGIPVNIRWQMYPSYDEVELENKFAPM